MTRNAKVLGGLALGILLAAVTAGRAVPCSLPAYSPHQLDPAATGDRTPPTLDAAPAVVIKRGPSPQQGCTGGSATSCDGIGSISITPVVRDDRTPIEQMGFRVRMVSGSLPDGLSLPSGDVRGFSGVLYLHWSDGTEDNHEAFSVTLEIVAVDTAGNASAPVAVVIADGGEGDGGCRVGHLARGGGRTVSPLGLAMLAVLGLLAGRRLRR